MKKLINIEKDIDIMKSFNDFLIESKKKYQFRIKIAGGVSDEQLDKLEAALEKWGIDSLSTPKTTPIQKNLPDFPLLKEMDMAIMDLSLDYPATSHEIGIRIQQFTEIPEEYIHVCSENDNTEQEQSEETNDSSVLTSPYPKSDEKKNPHYGDKFIKEFLKKEKNVPYSFKVAGGKTPKGETTNDLPPGKNSPISAKIR